MVNFQLNLLHDYFYFSAMSVIYVVTYKKQTI